MANTFSTQVQDCPIVVGDLSQSFDREAFMARYSEVFLLTDHITAVHCLPLFLEKTGLTLRDLRHFSFPAGEKHKQIVVCARIWNAMLEAQLDRKAVVVNLGGGVVGDMGGFCAATYKRGIDFIHVPTTLLSATDASIGGKLGVDLDGVKNVVGIFCQPAAVYIDPEFFKTLSAREMRSGMAEVIKHGAISGGKLWDLLREPVDLNRADWASLLPLSVAVKVNVVEQDPLERGLRAVLNFGHTIGHAIETVWLNRPDPLTHGEAVALGMLCEAWLFEKETGGPLRPSYADLSAVTARYFDRWPRVAAETDAIWKVMLNDKKNETGRVRLALPGNEPYTLHWLPVDRERVADSLLKALPVPDR